MTRLTPGDVLVRPSSTDPARSFFDSFPMRADLRWMFVVSSKNDVNPNTLKDDGWHDMLILTSNGLEPLKTTVGELDNAGWRLLSSWI